jgi:S-adenosylmethionine/arginine decarboxylase-like enzyme
MKDISQNPKSSDFPFYLQKIKTTEVKKMQTLGRQILAEFYECDENILRDEEAIRKQVRSL